MDAVTSDEIRETRAAGEGTGCERVCVSGEGVEGGIESMLRRAHRRLNAIKPLEQQQQHPSTTRDSVVSLFASVRVFSLAVLIPFRFFFVLWILFISFRDSFLYPNRRGDDNISIIIPIVNHSLSFSCLCVN